MELVLKWWKLFPEPPGQPGEPSIVDFDNKSVTLRWGTPKDTGGRPITHYIVQKKDKFGGWFDALITDDLARIHNFVSIFSHKIIFDTF